MIDDSLQGAQPENPAILRAAGVERLIAVERAARSAGEAAGQWWGLLQSSAESVTTDITLDELFREALGAIREALVADTASVLVASEAGGELGAQVSVGLPEELSRNVGIPIGRGAAGRVMASRQPLVIDDLTQVEVFSPLLRESGLRSFVGVPLLAGPRNLGVLHVASYNLAHFSSADADLLGVVANSLASTVERVRLFESARAARHRAELMATRIGRLQRVTAALSAELDAKQVLRVILDEIGPELGEDLASCTIWAVEDDKLMLLRVNEAPVTALAFEELDLDGDLPGPAVVRSGEPIWLDSGDELRTRFATLSGAELSGEGLGVLPLRVRQRVLGVLVLSFRKRLEIDSEEKDLLLAMADQAAQALERGRIADARRLETERNAFLLRLATVLARASNYEETMQRLAEVAVPALGDLCLIDVIDEEGKLHRMVAHHSDPSRRPLVDELRTRFPPLTGGTHPSAGVLQTGRSLWRRQMDDEFLRSTCRDEEHFRLVKELGFDSYVAVPLVTEGEPLGAIVLVSSGSGRRFGPAHVARVEDLAHQVAAVVDKARRYERERHTAAVLQSSLLPGALPDVKDVKLAWRYLASNTGIEAGGDFYDVVQLREGVLWLMVGDVAGHDRHSAAMMGHLRSVARALIGQVRTPRGLIQALQRSWATLDFDRLATSIFCRLAPSSGELLVASAGHPAPLLLSDGGAEFLPVEPASPLGVRGPRIPQWAGTLEPGSALLLYTDGVMQARDLHVSVDEGMARLAGVAESCRPEPDTLCDRVLAALGTDRSDDVALLAVAIDRPAGGSPGPDAGSRDREGAGSPKGTGSPES